MFEVTAAHRSQQSDPSQGCDYVLGSGSRGEELSGKALRGLVQDHGVVWFSGIKLDLQQFKSLSGKVLARFGRDPSSSGNRSLVASDGTAYEAVRGSEAVPLHGELYSLPHPPDLLWLYCGQPADHGGQTTVCDGREFAKSLTPATRSLFEKNKIAFHHRWAPENWRHYFATDDIKRAKDVLRDIQGISIGKSESEDVLCFKHVTSAYSQGAPHEASAFVNGLVNILSRRSQGLCRATLESGEEIPEDVVLELGTTGDRLALLVEWNAGDALLIDNHRYLHGRRAFSGARQVVARFGWIDGARS